VAAVTISGETASSALIGVVSPSPAGPVDEKQARGLRPPPEVPLPRWRQVLALSSREIEFVFRWRRRLGEVFRIRGMISGGPVTTCHPDHIRSLFTADPELAPSLTGESSLLPIVGPNSVLTANGPRHLRQRKLLLPPFHGEAIDRYVEAITDIAEREIDRWPVGRPMALAPRMQAITLNVITSGILGTTGRPQRGSPAHGLAQTLKYLTLASTTPIAKVAEIVNFGHSEPVGLQGRAISVLDRFAYAVIAEHRSAPDLDERTDILAMIMRARTEEGEPLSDRELRDELLTLILAGFETTANSLAWAWERLVRNRPAYDALRDAVRDGDDPEGHVERVILETMRNRPVIPAVGRRVRVPWRLGDYLVPAGAPIVMSILLLHHREDLYPDPFAFRPERWVGHKQPDDPGDGRSSEAGRRTTIKPGTYEWIPFGGGTRRCLGAALAMAEQRAVLATMARRLDLEAADPAPEHAQHRNVTMIPAGGAKVVIRSRTA
jgi:cytochrome P450